MKIDHVVIIGAGGMGALFGAILQEGGLKITLIDTNGEHVAAMNQHGLRIEGYGGDRVIAVSAHESAGVLEKADLLLFQCKSHGTRDAARDCRHLTEAGAVAVSFQNGLGNEEAMAEELGEASVLGGLTAMAGYMLGPGHIRDFSRVPSYLGEMKGGESARANAVAARLTEAGLETKVSGDIRREIWKKLLGNIAMSAVSGITDLTSAEALSIPSLRETSLRALDEARDVAVALDIVLDREEALTGLEAITTPGGTGDNKSSLCVDILNQRPSEVEYIYGTVIAHAERLGIATPTLRTLASLIRGTESHYVKQT